MMRHDRIGQICRKSHVLTCHDELRYDTIGCNRTGQDRTGQDRAGQGRAGQGRAGQGYGLRHAACGPYASPSVTPGRGLWA